jgi:hypothetical protein
MKPVIVCLCGSTRFADKYTEVTRTLTLDGKIVLSVGVFTHTETLPQDVKDMLDNLHLRKIDLADYVYIINVGGYVGESTRQEIEYALSNNKPVEYLI